MVNQGRTLRTDKIDVVKLGETLYFRLRSSSQVFDRFCPSDQLRLNDALVSIRRNGELIDRCFIVRLRFSDKKNVEAPVYKNCFEGLKNIILPKGEGRKRYTRVLKPTNFEERDEITVEYKFSVGRKNEGPANYLKNEASKKNRVKFFPALRMKLRQFFPRKICKNFFKR